MGLEEYEGITYLWPHKYKVPGVLFKAWRKFCCKKNVHLFDEVYSFGFGRNHYLVCDACELIVNISSIDKQYVKEEK